MPVSTSPRTRLSRVLCCIFSIILLTFAATNCRAASIRGIVTDARGAKITGANVALISQRESCCHRYFYGGREFSDSDRGAGAVLPGGLGQELPAD